MDCTLSMDLPQTNWLAGSTTFGSSQPAPPSQTTMLLIANAQSGDLNAFNQLVVNTQGAAYQLAYHLLQSEDAAADVVQESFIKAWRGLAAYRGGSFKSWFLRIVTNTCYDLLRKQKRQATTSFEDLPVETDNATQLTTPIEEPEDYAERMELRQWLERGISTLPAEQRVMVVLHDIEGYSYNEIVEISGIPMGTVKSRLSRGRIKLRDYLLRHKILPV